MKQHLAKMVIASIVSFFSAQGVWADDYGLVDKERAASKKEVQDVLVKSTNGKQQSIGKVTSLSGKAIVIRKNGTKKALIKGMKIYVDDIVETFDKGAVNIDFVDRTKLEVDPDSRIAMDDFVYDPDPVTNNPSVLRSVIQYTSQLIGRPNPDQIELQPRTGGTGIRG